MLGGINRTLQHLSKAHTPPRCSPRYVLTRPFLNPLPQYLTQGNVGPSNHSYLRPMYLTITVVTPSHSTDLKNASP